jgi:exonuclease III
MMMASRPGQQGPPLAANTFFKLITFNMMKRTDLSGLPTLLRDIQPHIVFLQEVLPSTSLQTVAGPLGYQVWTSTAAKPSTRTIAVLSRLPNTQVEEEEPGYIQEVTIGDFSFLHFHLPAAGRELLRKVRPRLRKPLPPILIGDFNCVIDPQDVQGATYYANKYSVELDQIVQEHSYCDAYRVLFPATVRYSWHRRGFAASRLDRAYLPALLEDRPRVARYIATTSDHHAFYLMLEAAGLPLLPADHGRPGAAGNASYYWKLNTSALQEEDFQYLFAETWAGIVSAQPEDPLQAGDWWEEDAKPAIRDFLQSFSKECAARKFQSRRYFTKALEQALLTENWEVVENCRRDMKAIDQWIAAGVAARTKQPVVEGEEAGVFHAAMEGRGGKSSGLQAVRKVTGEILREPAAVEEEVFSFYEAIFQGRHRAAVAAGDPQDSGQSFQPDETLFPAFLQDLPSLSPEVSGQLEQAFTLSELQAAIEDSQNGKSPGIDGIPYEFYKVTFALVGRPLLAALNAMLATGRLGASLRKGVVRLLPKVAGIPKVTQLRPITLLTTDYKLLTKMLVARLLRVLPDLLLATQLCSVKGRSIFDGAAAILSTAAFLEQHQLPGFLVSFDFFHGFDRVSLQWVDKVLEAMGFGQVLRQWIVTLHSDAVATFMLANLSPELQVRFSIRQGDPLALVLFVVQMEPYLVRLEKLLKGVYVGQIREASLGYVDDLHGLGRHLGDLQVLDEVTRDFEAVSGQILNRSCKSTIMGLGEWAGRHDWPLPWLQSVEVQKVYGVMVTPSFEQTVAKSWDRVAKGIEATLRMWDTRHLATLQQRSRALEMFAFSKAWYLAQILPLPQVTATKLERAARAFLWRGRFEHLAWDEIHGRLHEGGLAVSNVMARGQALLAKQACHRLAGGGRPSRHLAYWIGLKVQRALPEVGEELDLGRGPHAEQLPDQYQDLADLLLEVADLDCVQHLNLGWVKARLVYRAFMETPPPPKVQAKFPDIPWKIAWSRLATTGLPVEAVDVAFSAIHNILPLNTRMHKFKKLPSPACNRCGAANEDTLHFFTACPRVVAVWEQLHHRVATILGGPVDDRRLLMMAWPGLSMEDRHISLAIVCYIQLAWEAKDEPGDLVYGQLLAKVEAVAAIRPLRSIFSM